MRPSTACDGPAESTDPSEQRSQYHAFEQFARPHLVRLLRAVGLDVLYHRGEGDYLFYRDEQNRERRVLDLAGGYGANVFGHNNPRLVERLTEALQAKRPVLAQASVRGLAGALAQRLSQLAGQESGRRYLTTFVNSGTESVEAAIKHALLETVAHREQLQQELDLAFQRVRLALAGGLPASRLIELAAPSVRPGDDSDAVLRQMHHTAAEALDRLPSLLAIRGAFHGRTLGSLSLTDRPAYRVTAPLAAPAVVFLPRDDIDAARAVVESARRCYDLPQIDHKGELTLVQRSFVAVAACFVEPIQGEGGMHELSSAFLATLRELADEAGFPLVFDEIQSGMGRTGQFLASQTAGVRGDYYLLSKALGGGLTKIGALMVDEQRYVPQFGYIHTSTFADDDLSCAVVLGALDLLTDDDAKLMRDCADKGQHLLAALRQLQQRFPDQIVDVRGRGLMVGIELAGQRHSRSPLLRALSQQGLLGALVSGYLLRETDIRVVPSLSAGNTLRLEPSAYIDKRELDALCEAIEPVLVALRESNVFELTRFLVGRSADSANSAAHVVPVEKRAACATAARPDHRPTSHVAFLAHFLEPIQLRAFDRGLHAFTPADCDRFLTTTRGLLDPFILEQFEVSSTLDASVDVTVIGLSFTAEQAMQSIRDEDPWALELVREGVALARQLGCQVVGFGAYTSVLTEGCSTLPEQQLSFTSGNSLTAMAALEASLQATKTRGITRPVIGVLGGVGNLGAALAELAAPHAQQLVLVGRRGAVSRLEKLAATLAARTSVEIATDAQALRQCHTIICATNAPRPVLLPEHVGEGPVVICDVAAPGDVDPAMERSRPEALVLVGGQVRLPSNQQLHLAGVEIAPGSVYGCFAETLLVGLAGIREHFSRGPLVPERMRFIRQLADEHGFQIEPQPRNHHHHIA